MKTSRLASKTTGLPVQPNKAIVGANAFAHTSGIHQDGLLKEETTYEIMQPQSVGLGKSKMVMGKLSGRHAFRNHLEEMGYKPSDSELNSAFQRFKRLAEQKKEIFEEDIEAIISEEVQSIPCSYILKHLRVESGTDMTPTATIPKFPNRTIPIPGKNDTGNDNPKNKKNGKMISNSVIERNMIPLTHLAK